MWYRLCDLAWKRVVSFLLDFQETHRRKFSFAPLLKYHRTTQFCIPYVPFPPPRFHSLGQEIFALHSLETYVLTQMTTPPLQAVSCIYVPHQEKHGPCPYSIADIKSMWTSRGGM